MVLPIFPGSFRIFMDGDNVLLKSLLKAWTKIVAVLSISSSWELDFIAFKKPIMSTILPLVGAVISCKGINIRWIWCRSTVSRPWFGVANSERFILCILTMTAAFLLGVQHVKNVDLMLQNRIGSSSKHSPSDMVVQGLVRGHHR